LEDIYDGRWIVGQSSHPPGHEFKVEFADKTHPITSGLEDFKTFDELYTGLNEPKHSQVLLRTRYQGKDRPLAWAGRYEGSKVACSALGHDLKSYDAPQMRKFFVNTVQWLVSK
jgi:type 1 glutamine amidotransferase